MRILSCLAFMVYVLLLNGCSHEDQDQEHIYSTQKKALDQAKQVEHLSEELEKKRRQALKDQ